MIRGCKSLHVIDWAKKKEKWVSLLTIEYPGKGNESLTWKCLRISDPWSWILQKVIKSNCFTNVQLCRTQLQESWPWGHSAPYLCQCGWSKFPILAVLCNERHKPFVYAQLALQHGKFDEARNKRGKIFYLSCGGLILDFHRRRERFFSFSINLTLSSNTSK